MKEKNKLTVHDIALMGMMLATIEVGKIALQAIPNVEIVTFLIIVYTIYFGRKVIFVIPAFILLEGCMHGFGIWWIMYAYVWVLLSVLAYLFRKNDSVWFWSVFSGIFGLLFGALCSLTYLVIGGPKMALTWWVAGFSFDVIHCISNFILCFILYIPITKVLDRFIKQQSNPRT